MSWGRWCRRCEVCGELVEPWQPMTAEMDSGSGYSARVRATWHVMCTPPLAEDDNYRVHVPEGWTIKRAYDTRRKLERARRPGASAAYDKIVA